MTEVPPRWLDTRLRLAKLVRRAVDHVFPDHWSFMLGEVALYSFVVLVITGTFLALFFKGGSGDVVYHGSYHPLAGRTMSEAYRSVLHISFDVPLGLLVRQMHHWAANIFVGAIVAHLARIFFTAAYRRPREINWLIGLTLLVLALANGFFGYSICDDLLSGAGVRVGYAIVLSIPLIGPWLAFLFFGGMPPAESIVPRFYALHIFLVPALISLLIGVHLAIIWRQMHTNYPGPNRTDRTIVGSRLWPSYTLKSLGLFFLVFGVDAGLGALVQIDPVWVYGPNNPAAILPGAQPDWYLGWIEGAMRLFPGINLHLGHWLVPELFFPAVLFPGLIFLFLYSWPWIDKLIFFDFREHNVLRLPWQQPFNTALGCSLLMMVLVLLTAGGDDVIAVITDSSVVDIRVLLRILFFIAPAVTWMVTYSLCRWKLARHVRAEKRAAAHEELRSSPAQASAEQGPA